MKIKIRTKEGEFIDDAPNVIKVENGFITTLWPDGIEITEKPMLEWGGFEVIEQVPDDTEVTLPVQERHSVEGQFKFKIWNFNKDLTNKDEGAE